MGRKTTTLRWCPECDIPVIDRRSCPVCGSRAQESGIPACDMRPAFPHDLGLIRRLVSEHYGCDADGFLGDCVVVLFGGGFGVVGDGGLRPVLDEGTEHPGDAPVVRAGAELPV